MIKHSFVIGSLSCSQTNPAKPDLVVALQVQFMAVDDTDGISANMGAVLKITEPDQFILFHELTEGVVNLWVENHEQFTKIKESLEGIIAMKQNPPVIERTAPWISKVVV